MPELAELRLTADLINRASEDAIYNNIVKNHVHKGNDVKLPFNQFTISAQSRGKELMITFNDVNSDESKKLLMTMGMSGHFIMTVAENPQKHAHLNFFTTDGRLLSFVDVRRFGKWKFADDWSKNRGPDPVFEYELFKENILTNLDKKDFDKPIHLFLMNQKYCNGIGNYLRAEILYRLPDVSPWSSAREVIKNNHNLLELCKDIPALIYYIQGGNIYNIPNQLLNEAIEYNKVIVCYANPSMSKIKDKNGRTFWFDSKWN